MKTRDACILLMVVGFIVHLAYFDVVHNHSVTLTNIVTAIFFLYMLSVPVTLFFLRGEVPWRLATLSVWVIVVGLWVYGILGLID